MPTPARRRAARLAVGALGAAALLVGPLPPAGAAKSDEVWITFNNTQGGQEITSVRNSGRVRIRQWVLTENGGVLVARTSSRTGGRAADYPAFDDSADGPRAVVAVRNRGTRDRLSPRSRRFAFGADVRIDATSAGGSYDDGNNVVQRGLYAKGSQFKIEVEGRRPACRVSGRSGAVTVTASSQLVADDWYRIACRRLVRPNGHRVELTVDPLSTDAATVTARSRLRRIGRLRFSRRVPISVGGKVDSSLDIQDASDQFNGRIDNVFLRID